MARSSDPKKSALWRGRFRRFLDSGLSVARFCADEKMSESSFYYWQKKLGPQSLRRPARAEDRDTRAKTRSFRAKDRGASADSGGVFRAVTVVPTVCGVVVRLPGGAQIEVDADPLEAIRAIVAQTVRVDRDREADRSACSRCLADRQHDGAASC